MKILGIMTSAATIGLLVVATVASAEPIIKPRKYHGPIPPSSFSLRVGFFGGAENTEMISFLDRDKKPPFEANSEDFGNGLSFDIMYLYKLHPQFGFRANGGVTFLRSQGTGFFVPDISNLPDSVLAPALDYERKFDVDLFVLEASGVYFFTDAAVKDFQPYAGAGFSMGIPHAKFEEVRVDHDTGELFETIERSEWSVEAGVHAMLGALYYVNNRFAFSGEARLQLMESKFALSAENEFGELEDVNFVVNYTGFLLSLGVAWAF